MQKPNGHFKSGDGHSTKLLLAVFIAAVKCQDYTILVERYWKGKTEVLGEKHYTVWVVDGWMSMEQWWNGTDRGKLKCWEKNIIQCGW